MKSYDYGDIQKYFNSFIRIEMEPVMKIEPLTEELKSKVRNYFQTWEMWWLTESYIWLTYWRMRYHWIRIDKAEEYLRKKREEKDLLSKMEENEDKKWF